MVTVVYRIVAKKGKEKQLKKIAFEFVNIARKSKDCIRYSFFQSLTNSKELIVHYVFTNLKAQNKHIEKLHEAFGPTPLKRDLPKKFLSLIKEEELVLFRDDEKS